MSLEIPPYLSPSSIDTFRTCPLKYKFSKIDKLVDLPSEATVLGNFVHDVLEDLFNLEPTERTKSNAMKLLADQWASNWEAQVLTLDPVPDIKLFKWKARWCVENYFEMESPSEIEPYGMETEIPLVEVAGIPIKGFIDRWDPVDGGIRVVDYKTGKSPKPKYQDGKFQQLLIYADALETMTGQPAKKTALLFVKDKNTLERDVTPVDIGKMRDVVKGTYEGILERCEAEFFEPKKQILCDYCSYRSICPAWSRK